MFNEKDVAKIYDTIMSIPGMNEKVKIDMKISRRNILLLNNIVKRGLNNESQANLLEHMPEEALQELNALVDECLIKADLMELSEKIKVFDSK